jgi:CxxC motif-containing protein (DUF1111 family)
MQVAPIWRRSLWMLSALLSVSATAQTTNLATNATATGSTNLQPASLAVDGDMNTRWESEHAISPSSLTLDLGQQYALSQVVIHWEAANAETYEIVGSNDGSTWQSLSVQTGGQFGHRTDTVTVSGNWRYVRIIAQTRSTGNDWGYSIWEVEVYGTSTTSSSSSSSTSSVASGTALTVQAEDYVNYYDTTAGNQGGAYRNDDVDIEATTDGGYNVGWIATGEWLEQDVTLEAGTYDVTVRVASGTGGGNYAILLNGSSLGSFPVDATGGWQSWVEQPAGTVQVPSTGVYTVRMNANTGSFNLDWIKLTPTGTSSSSSSSSSSSTSSSSSSAGGETEITNSGGTVTAQYNDSPAGEGVANLTDNDINTKYLTFNASAWVQLQVSEPYVVTRYTLTSANDSPERDPLNWTLQGSNNGSTWTTIDSRSNEDFPNRFQTREFTFNNSAGYSYYRFNLQNNSGSILQLAEIELFGTPGSGTSSSSSSSSSTGGNTGNVVPLYNSSTPLEGAIVYDRGDALVTRISDRARDRHAKEDHFQAYDHFLSFYWEHRTAAIEIVDYVAKGGSSIRMNVVTQWKLNDLEAENRWFYIGVNTVAEYCDNGTMVVVDTYHYYKERSHNCRENRAIQIGDKLEFELSQFLDPSVPNGRAPYYGTTYLYIVGEGLVPWDVGGATPAGGIKDSVKIPESAWLGGGTTLHEITSDEPDNAFIQMATNLGYDNGQPFVLGRRVHHTSFVDGSHDEHPTQNPIFNEMVGKSGTRYVNDRCAGCHVRNGRAAPVAVGEPLDKWIFKVADANGNPHPDLGRALQPKANGGAVSEGDVSIAFWSESNGLRSPNYQFTGVTPDRFSARIAPQLVGIGLLEAVPESTVLAKEDINDANGDGISGKANRVTDPVTGETRLGRFGYKASTTSVKHQIASAFNLEMGVMTSVLPNPDCGASQSGCGSSGSELTDQHLENLVKYVALLGVRPQRNYNDPAVQRGETLFSDIGCAGCHTPTVQTSDFHPFAELRSQTIHPYTDLLLHDMGPGLADNLGEGNASGSEWRTAPLWGLGRSACVTGGVTNPTGAQGDDVCTPVHSYLHDGRARSIEEAILWHGGEGEASKNSYQALSSSSKQDLLRFLESL